jgi:hypothetical protein
MPASNQKKKPIKPITLNDLQDLNKVLDYLAGGRAFENESIKIIFINKYLKSSNFSLINVFIKLIGSTTNFATIEANPSNEFITACLRDDRIEFLLNKQLEVGNINYIWTEEAVAFIFNYILQKKNGDFARRWLNNLTYINICYLCLVLKNFRLQYQKNKERIKEAFSGLFLDLFDKAVCVAIFSQELNGNDKKINIIAIFQELLDLIPVQDRKMISDYSEYLEKGSMDIIDKRILFFNLVRKYVENKLDQKLLVLFALMDKEKSFSKLIVFEDDNADRLFGFFKLIDQVESGPVRNTVIYLVLKNLGNPKILSYLEKLPNLLESASNYYMTFDPSKEYDPLKIKLCLYAIHFKRFFLATELLISLAEEVSFLKTLFFIKLKENNIAYQQYLQSSENILVKNKAFRSTPLYSLCIFGCDQGLQTLKIRADELGGDSLLKPILELASRKFKASIKSFDADVFDLSHFDAAYEDFIGQLKYFDIKQMTHLLANINNSSFLSSSLHIVHILSALGLWYYVDNIFKVNGNLFKDLQKNQQCDDLFLLALEAKQFYTAIKILSLERKQKNFSYNVDKYALFLLETHKIMDYYIFGKILDMHSFPGFNFNLLCEVAIKKHNELTMPILYYLYRSEPNELPSYIEYRDNCLYVVVSFIAEEYQTLVNKLSAKDRESLINLLRHTPEDKWKKILDCNIYNIQKKQFEQRCDFLQIVFGENREIYIHLKAYLSNSFSESPASRKNVHSSAEKSTKKQPVVAATKKIKALESKDKATNKAINTTENIATVVTTKDLILTFSSSNNDKLGRLYPTVKNLENKKSTAKKTKSIPADPTDPRLVDAKAPEVKINDADSASVPHAAATPVVAAVPNGLSAPISLELKRGINHCFFAMYHLLNVCFTRQDFEIHLQALITFLIHLKSDFLAAEWIADIFILYKSSMINGSFFDVGLALENKCDDYLQGKSPINITNQDNAQNKNLINYNTHGEKEFSVFFARTGQALMCLKKDDFHQAALEIQSAVTMLNLIVWTDREIKESFMTLLTSLKEYNVNVATTNSCK